MKTLLITGKEKQSKKLIESVTDCDVIEINVDTVNKVFRYLELVDRTKFNRVFIDDLSEFFKLSEASHTFECITTTFKECIILFDVKDVNNVLNYLPIGGGLESISLEEENVTISQIKEISGKFRYLNKFKYIAKKLYYFTTKTFKEDLFYLNKINSNSDFLTVNTVIEYGSSTVKLIYSENLEENKELITTILKNEIR